MFLCTPHTVWGDWDNDAVLVIRIFGVMGLLITMPFGVYLYKEKKLINLLYDTIIVVFCLYKIITTIR